MKDLFARFKTVGVAVRKDLSIDIPEPSDSEKFAYKRFYERYSAHFAAKEMIETGLKRNSLWLLYQGLELLSKHRLQLDSLDLRDLPSCEDLSFIELIQEYRDILKHSATSQFLLEQAIELDNLKLIDKILEEIPNTSKSDSYLLLVVCALNNDNTKLLNIYGDEIANIKRNDPVFLLTIFLVGARQDKKNIKNWAIINGFKTDNFKLAHSKDQLSAISVKSLIKENQIEVDSEYLLKRFDDSFDIDFIKILMEYKPEFNILDEVHNLIKADKPSSAHKILELGIKPSIETFELLLELEPNFPDLFKIVISKLNKEDVLFNKGSFLSRSIKINIPEFNLVSELMKATKDWPEEAINQAIISSVKNSRIYYLETLLKNHDKYSIPLINRLHEDTQNNYIRDALKSALKSHLKENWQILSDNEIMKELPLGGHKILRKIFNFKAKNIVILFENNSSGEISSPQEKNFSDHESDAEIIEAFNILSKFKDNVEEYLPRKSNNNSKKDKSPIVLLKDR